MLEMKARCNAPTAQISWYSVMPGDLARPGHEHDDERQELFYPANDFGYDEMHTRKRPLDSAGFSAYCFSLYTNNAKPLPLGA